MRLLPLICSVLVGLALPAQPPLDPPPVNEEALARRLFEMTKPTAGERAIIVADPTYYPGITSRLRELLHERGVSTSVIQEDSPAMIASYLGDPSAGERREREIIDTWLPLFRRSDIFYWMPSRGYADDLRWERLVERSKVRSVHFHWILRFPAGLGEDAIRERSRVTERRALEVDFDDHARRQESLARAMRGRSLRITTPEGTDLVIGIPQDQWFHFGNGDASRERADRARSIRDRQIELPVGMFNFVPRARDVSGILVAPAIAQAGEQVRNARFRLVAGRATVVRADTGDGWIRARIPAIGPDGDLIGTIFIGTHPMDGGRVTIDIGSNWENGGRNRAQGMRRMTIGLLNATVVAGDRTLVRDGVLQWGDIP